MQGSSSSGGAEGHSKRKTAQPTGKKDGKSNSSMQSSKSQDAGSQSSDVNQQIKEKNRGKQVRPEVDNRKSERLAAAPQGEKKEQKRRTSSDVTSQSLAQKQPNENGGDMYFGGTKQKIEQQIETMENAFGLNDPTNLFLQQRTASQMETQEQLSVQLQKLIENRGNHPTITLGPSTSDYFINDYNINVLPDRNPIQRVIDDFVGRRHAYQSFKVKDSGTSSSASVNAAAGGGTQPQQPPQRPPKPRLEEFLGCLQEHVFMVNKIYKVSKQQFEDDVKAFKYIDDEEEEQEDQGTQKDQTQQPQPWNFAEKQPDKSKKTDGSKEEDGGIFAEAEQLATENHKVNDITESQPSLSDQLTFPKHSQSGQAEGKDGENKLALAGAAGANSLIGQPPYYQPFQNPMQVPLNGPLRSINNIMLTQQMNLIANPAPNASTKSGMAGQVLQVPLSKKQQRSQTVQNFIQYLAEFYDGFESQANVLQGYYPKHIQKCIQKKKSQNAERIAQSIKVPSFFNGGPSSKLSQKQQKRKAKKALSKMSMLTKFQATMMQVVLQKIDRRSKPIRKQTKIVTNSLHEKQIHLEEEDFDILQLLRQNNQARDKDRDGQSQSEGPEQPRSQSDQRTKIKDPIGLPDLSTAKVGQEKIGGLNNLANLSEIDLTLTKGASKTKAISKSKPAESTNPCRLPSSTDTRAPQLQQSDSAPGSKKSKVDQRKLDREERMKEREKEKGRKEASKNDNKCKGKNDHKEDVTTKKMETEAKNSLVGSAVQNKKRGREQGTSGVMASPAYQGKQAKMQQQKHTAGRDQSTFGLSCTAARKVQRPHQFNPYEVSSFQEKQKIEQLLCSGDVVRPHKISDQLAEEDETVVPVTVQQPLSEKKIQFVPPAPQQSGAKHKSKHGRKNKKGDGTLNLSKGTCQAGAQKAEEKIKKDDPTSSKSDQQNLESQQQQSYQQYMLGSNGPNMTGFPDYNPQPFSLHPAGSMGYNMHIGNVYYHQHHEHHHYGPPMNHPMMFGFPTAHPHNNSPFLAPPPPPQYYKHPMQGNNGIRLNSNGSKQSGGKSPIDHSADDMIIPPMMHRGAHDTTTPKGNLYQMGTANLGSGSNNQAGQHRTHMQTFHHHHYHTSAFPGANKSATQGQLALCPRPPRGPISIQTNNGLGGSSVCSPDAKIVTSTTNNYDQQRNVGATKFYQSVNQASAAMLCGGATGGFNHNISPSPQNNYKLAGGNMGIGMSAGQTQSKDGSSLINLQPCEMGAEYHTNVGPGNLSGISEFVLPLHPVPMNNMDKELGTKDTPAGAQNAVDGRTGNMGMSQPLFNQEAFSIAATADFMNNQTGQNSGRQDLLKVPQPVAPALSTHGHYSSITPKSALLKLDCHFFSTGNVPPSRNSQLGAGVLAANQGQNVASSMMNIGAIPTPGAGASGSMSSLANVASMVQIVPGPKNSGRSGTLSHGDSSILRRCEK